MAISIRGSLASSFSALGGTVATSLTTGWTGSPPAAGDLILISMEIQSASAGSFSQSAGTGSWTFHTASVTDTVATNAMCAWIVMTGSTTSPTWTLPSTTKGSYVLIALTPDAGSTISIDTFATDLVTSVAGTSITPNSVAAAGSGEVSVVISALNNSATGATVNSFSALCSGYTTGATAGGGGGGGTKADFSGVQSLIGVSGTVAPGAMTMALSCTGITFHALVQESAPATVTNAVQEIPPRMFPPMARSFGPNAPFQVAEYPVTFPTPAAVPVVRAAVKPGQPAALRRSLPAFEQVIPPQARTPARVVAKSLSRFLPVLKRAFARAPLTVGSTPATQTSWPPQLRVTKSQSAILRPKKAFASVVVIAAAIPIVPHSIQSRPARPAMPRVQAFRAPIVVKPVAPVVFGSRRPGTKVSSRNAFFGTRQPLPSALPWTVTFLKAKPSPRYPSRNPGFFGTKQPLPSSLPWTTTFLKAKTSVRVQVKSRGFSGVTKSTTISVGFVGSKRIPSRVSRSAFFRGIFVPVVATTPIHVSFVSVGSPPRKPGRGAFAKAPLTVGFTPSTLTSWPPRLKAIASPRSIGRPGKFSFVFVPQQVVSVPIVPKPFGSKIRPAPPRVAGFRLVTFRQTFTPQVISVRAGRGTIRHPQAFLSSIRVPVIVPQAFGAKRTGIAKPVSKFFRGVSIPAIAPRPFGSKQTVSRPRPGVFFRGITISVAAPIKAFFTSITPRLTRAKAPRAFRGPLTRGFTPPTVTTTPVAFKALPSPSTHAKSKGTFFPVIIGTAPPFLGGAPFTAVVAHQLWRAEVYGVSEWEAVTITIWEAEITNEWKTHVASSQWRAEVTGGYPHG